MPLRTCIIFRLRDVLDSFNAKSKDSPTFADELDIIMQYFVQFERYLSKEVDLPSPSKGSAS